MTKLALNKCDCIFFFAKTRIYSFQRDYVLHRVFFKAVEANLLMNQGGKNQPRKEHETGKTIGL